MLWLYMYSVHYVSIVYYVFGTLLYYVHAFTLVLRIILMYSVMNVYMYEY